MYIGLLRPCLFIRPSHRFEAKLHYKLRLLQILNSDPIPMAAIKRHPDHRRNAPFRDNELNLEEYFAQTSPPLTMAETNIFWVKVLDILNSVAKVHSLSNSGENAHGQRRNW